MKKIDQVIGAVERWVSILLMMAMALCILLQVIFRLTGIQVSWTEELARYLFISVTYYGSVYAVRHHRHLKVEIIEAFSGPRGKFILRLITNISSILFYILLAYIFINYFEYLNRVPQVSPVLRVNIMYVYAAPFALALFGIYELLKDTIVVIKTKEV